MLDEIEATTAPVGVAWKIVSKTYIQNKYLLAANANVAANTLTCLCMCNIIFGNRKRKPKRNNSYNKVVPM